MAGHVVDFFFLKKKPAYDIWYGLVGWDMFIRDRYMTPQFFAAPPPGRAPPPAAELRRLGLLHRRDKQHKRAVETAGVTFMGDRAALYRANLHPVSYTHLTLPTSDLV